MPEYICFTQRRDRYTDEVKPRFIVGVRVYAPTPEDAAHKRFYMLAIGEPRENCTAVLVTERTVDPSRSEAWVFPVIPSQPMPATEPHCFTGARA